MISDMLKEESIQILDYINDWRDAIHISLRPLEKGGYVKACYADEIIKNTEEIGPYYILTEDIALIHGRPEQGVIDKQIAVTLVRKPVWFSEDSFPVRVLIALAATDSDSHMDVMKVLSSIFIDKEKIENMVNSKSEREIYGILLNEESERRK